MIRGLRGHDFGAVLGLTLLSALWPGAVHAQAQIPPSVELRVPKPPTVAAGSEGAFLAYELHVTNLTPGALRLTRVDVLDDVEEGAVVATMADSVLAGAISRPGVRVPAGERATIGGGLRAIVYLWVPIRREAAPAGLRHRVTLVPVADSAATDGAAGPAVVHVIDGAHIAVSPAGPTIRAPLRGEWMAANGPSHVSGHRRLVLALNGNVASGQRFGIDFVRMAEGGGTFAGDRTKNESYHAYGQDALAVADGVVVETKDGIPENVPGPQSRAVPITLETVSGNSVVIDLGGGRYAFYAHLIPGSLRVEVGDRVTRGQIIGSVGNSGNSTEPHLHFHMVDGVAPGTSTLGAEGIPYGIDQFHVIGECTSFEPGGCTRSSRVVVQGGIPLQNQIVRFPE